MKVMGFVRFRVNTAHIHRGEVSLFAADARIRRCWDYAAWQNEQLSGEALSVAWGLLAPAAVEACYRCWTCHRIIPGRR